MKTQLSASLALVLLLASPAFAQHRAHGESWPRANAGELPPPPTRRSDGHARPEAEHRGERTNAMPHVVGNRWFGHDAPHDPRFHLDKPFEHGRFEHFGPSHRHHVVRLDPHHHRCVFEDGFIFDIAVWDWPIWSGWCWDCGEDFVVYEDPDHVGWYLIYDVHTGGYVHALFMGRG